MFRQYLLSRIGLLTLYILVCLPVSNAHAREVGVAFIEDTIGETDPRLARLIVDELQPLLDRNDTVVPIYLSVGGAAGSVQDAVAKALAAPGVDYLVATGLIGSQEIYRQQRFAKPTWLLRVLDPALTGAPVRDEVQNLRSYSTRNELVDIFARLRTLFQAKRVGIIVPGEVVTAQRSVGGAVAAAAAKSGIDVQFLPLDFSRPVDPQLPMVDAIVLPPVSFTAQQSGMLLQALQRRNIPSFAVGGDAIVLQGALISDTLDEDERVFARRVALDMQLAISGEGPTRGIRWLEPKKRTTINIDTATAMGVDFTLDELLTARVVQGNRSGLSLGFLAALQLATDQNLDLRGQNQQVRIDHESLQQALGARWPQLAAQIGATRRSELIPPVRDATATVSVSQTLYSASANADVKVARLGLDASAKTLEQQKLDTVQQTAGAYFQALQTQAQFESSLRDLALSRENLSLAEQRKRSGSGSGAEIYRWQATIANSESALLQAYTANTRAQSQLAQLLNMRLQIPSQLADVDLNQPPFDLLHETIKNYLTSTGKAEMLREASAARALSLSPQIDIAQANVAISNTSLKALRRAYYTPELSLTGQYSTYLDSTANAGGAVLDGEDYWTLSLNAELPLWLGGTRSSLVRQFRAQSELAETRLQGVRLALWANSGDAVNALIANYRAIGLSKLAETAALKSQQITQNAYRLGAASVTELLDTQNAWREAQDSVHIARYQYLAALVDFQSLMGEMPMLWSGAEQQQWLQNFTDSMTGEASMREADTGVVQPVKQTIPMTDIQVPRGGVPIEFVLEDGEIKEVVQ